MAYKMSSSVVVGICWLIMLLLLSVTATEAASHNGRNESHTPPPSPSGHSGRNGSHTPPPSPLGHNGRNQSHNPLPSPSGHNGRNQSHTPPPSSSPSRPPSPSGSQQTPSTIVTACRHASDQQYCIKSLSSYHGADKADLRKLVEIALRLSIDQGDKVLGFVRQLLREKHTSTDHNALKQCVNSYWDTKERLKTALIVLSFNNKSRYQDVLSGVTTAQGRAKGCVDALNKAKSTDLAKLIQKISQDLTKSMDDAISVTKEMRAHS